MIARKMSIPLALKKIRKKEAQRLLADLSLPIRDTGGARVAECFRVVGDVVYVPIGYDTSWIDHARLPLPTRSIHSFKPTDPPLYSGAEQLAAGVDPDLVKDQVEITDEIQASMTSGGSYMMCISTGGGKTKMAVHLASLWKKKTLVMCGNSDILEQWMIEFNKSGVKTVRVNAPEKNGLDPEAVVYLAGVQVASKLTPDMTHDVDTVIYDEGHLATETAVTASLLNTTPSRLLILTASPTRSDGLDKALDIYCGKRRVTRILKKTFTAHRCLSHIVPKIKKTSINGKKRIDYNHAMDSIHESPGYYDMLEKLIRHIHGSEGRTLVLFRRNSIIFELSSRLTDVAHNVYNEDIKKDDIMGGDNNLILAIDRKAKEGVDIANVKRIVLTYSGNSVIQPEGRSRENEFDIYIIIHDHPMFEKHWTAAEQWFSLRSRETYKIGMIDMTAL